MCCIYLQLLEGKKNGVWLARFPFEYKVKFSKILEQGDLDDVFR